VVVGFFGFPVRGGAWAAGAVVESDGIGQGGFGHSDGAADEFGQVEIVEAGFVVSGVFLGEQEWFGEAVGGIVAGDEDAGEDAVEAFTAEDEPSAAGRPAMPGVGELAVDGQRLCLERLQVQAEDVAVRMEDGEAAGLTDGEEEGFAVG